MNSRTQIPGISEYLRRLVCGLFLEVLDVFEVLCKNKICLKSVYCCIRMQTLSRIQRMAWFCIEFEEGPCTNRGVKFFSEYSCVGFEMKDLN